MQKTTCDGVFSFNRLVEKELFYLERTIIAMGFSFWKL